MQFTEAGRARSKTLWYAERMQELWQRSDDFESFVDSALVLTALIMCSDDNGEVLAVDDETKALRDLVNANRQELLDTLEAGRSLLLAKRA